MVNYNLILHTLSYSGLSVFKNFFTKSYLLDFINNTSILSFLYTKHLIKFIIYLILFLVIPASQTHFFNSLKTTFFNYKDINAVKVILATIILGIIEIGLAFPVYLGLSTSKLSSFISSSTIATIIFNVILGVVVFKEVVTLQFIVGLCISIIGLYLILNSNGDS